MISQEETSEILVHEKVSRVEGWPRLRQSLQMVTHWELLRTIAEFQQESIVAGAWIKGKLEVQLIRGCCQILGACCPLKVLVLPCRVLVKRNCLLNITMLGRNVLNLYEWVFLKSSAA